jgi:hypothetical protein
VGRPGTGCQSQLIKTQRFGNFQCTAQMADVNRIESPAQHADASWHWLADGYRA